METWQAKSAVRNVYGLVVEYLIKQFKKHLKMTFTVPLLNQLNKLASEETQKDVSYELSIILSNVTSFGYTSVLAVLPRMNRSAHSQTYTATTKSLRHKMSATSYLPPHTLSDEDGGWGMQTLPLLSNQLSTVSPFTQGTESESGGCKGSFSSMHLPGSDRGCGTGPRGPHLISVCLSVPYQAVRAAAP